MTSKIITLALCAIALVGFFLPAVNVRMAFIGIERTSSFSLATPFDNTDSLFGDAGFANQSDLSNLTGDNLFQEIRGTMVLSIASYFVAFLLLVVTTICAMFGKLKRTSILLLALSAGLL